jgi:hypothetical protein
MLGRWDVNSSQSIRSVALAGLTAICGGLQLISLTAKMEGDRGFGTRSSALPSSKGLEQYAMLAVGSNCFLITAYVAVYAPNCLFTYGCFCWSVQCAGLSFYLKLEKLSMHCLYLI